MVDFKDSLARGFLLVGAMLLLSACGYDPAPIRATIPLPQNASANATYTPRNSLPP